VLVALVLCLVFRCALAWVGPGLSLIAGGWLIDREFGYAQQTIVEAAPDDRPRCLVLGTSRVGLGVEQELLAELTGWQVLKLPLSAGTPWDFVKLMEREERALDGVTIVIMDAEVYQLNDNCATRGGDRGPRLASYSDFAQNGEPVGSVGRALQEVWPIDRERRTAIKWKEGLLSALYRGRSFVPMDDRWRRYDEGLEPPANDGMAPAAAAGRHLREFAFSESMAQVWRDLANDCDREGVHLIVIMPPLQSAYLEAVDSNPTWREGYRSSMEFFESLATSPGVSVLLTDTPGAAGLSGDDDSLFMDYGHMTHAGATLYTRWLAERIIDQ